MTKEEKKGITVKKSNDIAEWYGQVCLKAELADYAPVKGCMILRPNGYAIWEGIRKYFDENINKPTGVRNAYFPLFIPERFFKLEASHAEGFNPEVAWLDKEVTGEGDRLAVRPTSETIMYDSYSKWIRSHKDLPLKINQWANVVRWETEATKLFIRSREFLWQEGHCVYATQKECLKDTINYINLYAKLCKDLLALPVIVGAKTDKEKFAGAVTTYAIEGFMPDGKALQCGTSHLLGQGFAKAFGINYLGKDEKKHLGWQNSWGLSTRLIGAVVMTHSDDKGLVLPPHVAENKLVIVPIYNEKNKKKVLVEAKKIEKKLAKFNPILDLREDYSPGWKYHEWELKGIPLRIEIGPRDIQNQQVMIIRRDSGKKQAIKIKDVVKSVPIILDNMHNALYKQAKTFLDSSIVFASNWKQLEKEIKDKKLVKANFCGLISCEDLIKDKTKGVTTRCIPFNSSVKKDAKCIHCNKKAKYEIYFSRAY